MLRNTIETTDKRLVCYISGRLDTITSSQLEADVTAEITPSTKYIELDGTELEYVSSAGLRVILSVKKIADRQKAKFKLTHINTDVREIFEISGFDEIIDIE